MKSSQSLPLQTCILNNYISEYYTPAQSTPLHTYNTTPLHNIDNKEGDIAGNIRARKDALQELRVRYPGLVNLYETLIESYFRAMPHERNDFIVKSILYLYRVVAPEIALKLVMIFYEMNRGLFHDPPEQHQKEAIAMMKSIESTYHEELSEEETEAYSLLNDIEKAVFRICRDLAFNKKKGEPGEFFMSCNHLADRMGIHSPQADRIIKTFMGYGILDRLEKGQQREAGVKARAGTYRYLLTIKPKHDK